jgi:hypothetical protein
LANNTAGLLGLIYVQTVDPFGNNITTNRNSTFAVTVAHQNSDYKVNGQASYISGGLYQITYNATVSGAYSINILLNGQPIKGAPFALIIAVGKLNY